MFDPPTRPHENPHLVSLLSHYARLGAEDRSAWQDRLMQMDGVDREQLTTLHGELIASDWIEQNTGRAVLRPDGTLAACYRVTPQGLREFRRIHGVEAAEEHPEASDKSPQRVPRRKREKQEVNESGAVAAAE